MFRSLRNGIPTNLSVDISFHSEISEAQRKDFECLISTILLCALHRSSALLEAPKSFWTTESTDSENEKNILLCFECPSLCILLCFFVLFFLQYRMKKNQTFQTICDAARCGVVYSLICTNWYLHNSLSYSMYVLAG